MTIASKRINARLPAEVARKVSYLAERTGSSTTRVVIASIEHYYESVATNAPADILTRAGFIGCADGPTDLSQSYKRDLAFSLAKKS